MLIKCGNCKEYGPFLKRTKGVLKEMGEGHCKVHKSFTYRSKCCKKYECKVAKWNVICSNGNCNFYIFTTIGSKSSRQNVRGWIKKRTL